MELVAFKVPRRLLELLDRLIDAGVFDSRSEAVREAVRRLVAEYIDLLCDVEFECPFCGRYFTTFSGLVNHVAATHIAAGVDRCPACGSRLSSPKALVRHATMLAHADGLHALLYIAATKYKYRHRVLASIARILAIELTMRPKREKRGSGTR